MPNRMEWICAIFFHKSVKRFAPLNLHIILLLAQRPTDNKKDAEQTHSGLRRRSSWFSHNAHKIFSLSLHTMVVFSFMDSYSHKNQQRKGEEIFSWVHRKRRVELFVCDVLSHSALLHWWGWANTHHHCAHQNGGDDNAMSFLFHAFLVLITWSWNDAHFLILSSTLRTLLTLHIVPENEQQFDTHHYSPNLTIMQMICFISLIYREVWTRINYCSFCLLNTSPFSLQK